MWDEYKANYSVVTLRVEMKELGRLLKIKRNEMSEQEINEINKAISDIKETLHDLKIKHNVYGDEKQRSKK